MKFLCLGLNFWPRLYFELNRSEVTWSSVKSFSDLYKQTQALFLVYNELHYVYGWHCNVFSGHFHCV